MYMLRVQAVVPGMVPRSTRRVQGIIVATLAPIADGTCRLGDNVNSAK